MNDQQRDIATNCLRAQENDRMPFAEAVATLSEAGFEGYMADLRRAATTFYLVSGENIELPSRRTGAPIAAAFDAKALEATLKDAGKSATGRSFRLFSDRIKRAGCAGFIVSFSGNRIVYFGRTGETHTELIPEEIDLFE